MKNFGVGLLVGVLLGVFVTQVVASDWAVNLSDNRNPMGIADGELVSEHGENGIQEWLQKAWDWLRQKACVVLAVAAIGSFVIGFGMTVIWYYSLNRQGRWSGIHVDDVPTLVWICLLVLVPSWILSLLFCA